MALYSIIRKGQHFSDCQLQIARKPSTLKPGNPSFGHQNGTAKFSWHEQQQRNHVPHSSNGIVAAILNVPSGSGFSSMKAGKQFPWRWLAFISYWRRLRNQEVGRVGNVLEIVKFRDLPTLHQAQSSGAFRVGNQSWHWHSIRCIFCQARSKSMRLTCGTGTNGDHYTFLGNHLLWNTRPALLWIYLKEMLSYEE